MWRKQIPPVNLRIARVLIDSASFIGLYPTDVVDRLVPFERMTRLVYVEHRRPEWDLSNNVKHVENWVHLCRCLWKEELV
jgi:hypothetical protein